MPHINRVRVNNVKYNFGTQFYDDFVMRFSCKNTIYDLANGGGKSVLMLLLLQNLIPNCTLDEKQPIEKLFRTSSGSNTIHSLIEWKLDACYQKDGYKYMTTGFCARKGKDLGEAIDTETANIEYFNYCIFYREFGDNDIKNLPLSANGERITYNGLKSYLRGLDKKDKAVYAQIFERKGDYQTFISQYGLFESEWEIIRGINKTEGHVRTYFENNYKTGRKVVEDLLIEEIIQKSFNNQIGNYENDDNMAKTLLDIKDKIIELSRKKEEIGIFDKQIELMKNLAEKLDTFADFQREKEGLKNQLVNKYAVCKALLDNTKSCIEQYEKDMVALESRLANEEMKIAVARYMTDERELNKLKELSEEYETKIARLNEEQKGVKDVIARLEAYQASIEIDKYNNLKQQVEYAISSTNMGEDVFTQECEAIASSAKRVVEGDVARLTQSKKEWEEKLLQSQEEYDRTKGLLDELLISVAIENKKSVNLLEEQKKYEAMKQEYTSRLGVIAVEDVESTREAINLEIEAIKDELNESQSEKPQLEKQRLALYENNKNLEIEQKLLEHSLKKLEDENNKEAAYKDIDKLYSVYNEANPQRLLNAIYSRYKKNIMDTAMLEVKLNSESQYVTNLENGRYVFDGKQYAQVEEYLFNTYGDDVMYGYQWFATLSASMQRDIRKRVPFIDYSFVILGDFERIRQDINLVNFRNASYIVPVISELITRDMRHAASVDYMLFATKDLSFLMDANKVMAEIEDVHNEIYNDNEELKRLKMSQEVLLKDYILVRDFIAFSTKATLEDEEQLNEKLKNIKNQRQAVNNKLLEISEALEIVLVNIETLEARLLKATDKKVVIDKLWEINCECEVAYNESLEIGKNIKSMENKITQYKEVVRINYDNILQAQGVLKNICEKIAQTNKDWEEVFSQYYNENATSQYYEDADIDALKSAIRAREAAFNSKNSDLSDKKTLIATYEENIQRLTRQILKRKFTLQEVKEWEDIGLLSDSGSYERYESRYEELQKEIDELDTQLQWQNAGRNRMEGSLSHAKSVIEEKYQNIEYFECDNLEAFVTEHKVAIKNIKESILDTKEKLKTANAQYSEITITYRELERMLQNAGMSVLSIVKAVYQVSMKDLSGYDELQKYYDKLNRDEYKRREEFSKDKRRIMDRLREYNAIELAKEIELSVTVPESIEHLETMKEAIAGTCQCIELERNHISRGIEDMERIKDSFENRCIQTCSNIKAELDRLPKLSKITLDNEVISMIGLSIPYVREEFYKERMSTYINDTVAFAESFKTTDEKISYIRGRLTWKKLFSVIVTDMNAIRLSLYKRERIKDQSRYLRYEEAVGSTGQSQGIYIQFLIAIINYISNINAAGKEASAIGKVVFIDNPFGAAKDVYIWEPIFKLLKTNHVQLIVPARGATPAITSRFDVNYILGQKMVNGRTQTVVVDYRSQVQNEEIEYQRLEYTQESMF